MRPLRVLATTCVGAVSYTHLDVYKRQGKAQTHVLEAEVDARGNLVYGLFDNVDVRSESRYDQLNTEFKQFNANLEHSFNDRWRLDALVGTSKSVFSNPMPVSYTHLDVYKRQTLLTPGAVAVRTQPGLQGLPIGCLLYTSRCV